MDIFEATTKFESWLARQACTVADDLEVKHGLMVESLGHFFRATYFRWSQAWPSVCAPVARVPRVAAAGDLHVDSFGTWRDEDARLVWGVHDLGELWRLPFTQDLVRLAASVRLAIEAGEVLLEPEIALAVLLDGYRAALERGGEPFVLAERHEHLAALVHERVRNAGRFWRAVEGAVLIPRSDVPEVPRKALVRALPRDAVIVGFGHRLGAIGSLGRHSYVVWGIWKGSLVGREACLAAPPTWAWTSKAAHPWTETLAAVRSGPARADDPSMSATPDGWVVRRIAPDCARIELASLPSGRHDARLLGAMGFETANLHMASRPGAELLAALDALPVHWLRECVDAMNEGMRHDWAQWCRQFRKSAPPA